MPSILILLDLYMINTMYAEMKNPTSRSLFQEALLQQFYILLPCINPLVSIATNTPYRNAAMFWRLKKKIEPNVVQVVSPITPKAQ